MVGRSRCAGAQRRTLHIDRDGSETAGLAEAGALALAAATMGIVFGGLTGSPAGTFVMSARRAARPGSARLSRRAAGWYTKQPHFFFLRADGSIADAAQGVIPADRARLRLERLLSASGSVSR